MKRCLSLVVLQIKLRAKAKEEAHSGGLFVCSSNVKRCVSIGICSVDVSVIPRLVTSQFKYDSFIAILSGSVQKLSAISVADSTSNLHCLEQVVQEVSIIVIHGILEALALFTLAAEPLTHERLMVSTSKLLAMLEQDLETLELVRETCEHKCTEHSILAHAADRVTRACCFIITVVRGIRDANVELASWHLVKKIFKRVVFAALNHAEDVFMLLISGVRPCHCCAVNSTFFTKDVINLAKSSRYEASWDLRLAESVS